MQYDILLTKTTSNGYTARPLLWPEIVGSGDSEAAAIAQVRKALASALNQSRVVQIELPAPEEMDDPWLRAAGMWQDMPEDEWNSFQDELARIRQTANYAVEHSTSNED